MLLKANCPKELEQISRVNIVRRFCFKLLFLIFANVYCMVRLHPEGSICTIQIVVVRFYSVNVLLFPQAAHNLAFGVLYGFPHFSQSSPICPSE